MVILERSCNSPRQGRFGIAREYEQQAQEEKGIGTEACQRQQAHLNCDLDDNHNCIGSGYWDSSDSSIEESPASGFGEDSGLAAGRATD